MCFFLVAGIDVGDETLRKENSISETFHKANSFKHVGPSFGKVLALFWEGVWWTNWEPRNEGRALQEVELGMEILQPQQAPLRADTSLGKGAVIRAAEWEHVFQLRIAEGSDISQSMQKRLKAFFDEEKCNSTLWSVSCLCLDNVFLVR